MYLELQVAQFAKHIDCIRKYFDSKSLPIYVLSDIVYTQLSNLNYQTKVDYFI